MLLFAGNAFAQSADQEVVSVIGSPDPVVPGQNITYTVTVRNNGPDAAVNGGLNVNLGGSLTHVSNTPPAGFTCFVAGANMTCNTPSFASGATVMITIVVRVDDSLLNFPDGSITSNFFSIWNHNRPEQWQQHEERDDGLGQPAVRPDDRGE